ncbi:MAG: hypothetical protein J2P36_17615 [Ktedonobacteraceae bacterium]|nr:hypothetical protein [Ktedonobacteraceae bacterium]
MPSLEFPRDDVNRSMETRPAPLPLYALDRPSSTLPDDQSSAMGKQSVPSWKANWKRIALGDYPTEMSSSPTNIQHEGVSRYQQREQPLSPEDRFPTNDHPFDTLEQNEVAIRHTEPESPCFYRDFPIADVLDFPHLAHQIKATIAESHPKEILYRLLQGLHREPEALQRLDVAYQAIAGQRLHEAMTDRFDGTPPAYAQHLLGGGDAHSRQAIWPLPRDEHGYEAIAHRIHAELQQPHPNVETIYAALTPLQRHARLLASVEHCYSARYQADLTRVLHSHLHGTSREYVRYLLGERAMEMPAMTMAEATRFTQACSRLTFLTSRGERKPVPFHYAPDGCLPRNHIMAQVLNEMGYRSETLCALAHVDDPDPWKRGNLRFTTDYSQDVRPGETPEVKWWCHVTQYLSIKEPGQPARKHVIDPTTAPEPQTAEQWLDRIAPHLLTVAEWKKGSSPILLAEGWERHVGKEITHHIQEVTFQHRSIKYMREMTDRFYQEAYPLTGIRFPSPQMIVFTMDRTSSLIELNKNTREEHLSHPELLSSPEMRNISRLLEHFGPDGAPTDERLTHEKHHTNGAAMDYFELLYREHLERALHQQPYHELAHAIRRALNTNDLSGLRETLQRTPATVVARFPKHFPQLDKAFRARFQLPLDTRWYLN